MTEKEIIKLIEDRRDFLRDVASQGTPNDLRVWTAADLAFEQARNYDELLRKIEKGGKW